MKTTTSGMGIALAMVLAANAWGADRVGQLDNGLSYVIRQTARPAGEIELRLIVKAGELDVNDAKMQGGMHLIEHMAFRNTRDYPNGSLVPYLRSQGFRFGLHLNGQTTPDATTYQLALPHANAQGLKNGLNILANMANGIQFEKDVLDAEKKVVAEEIRGYGNNPWVDVWISASKLALAQTPTGDWSYGTPDSINAMPVEQLREMYQRLYRANRMSVVVTGDVDPVEAEKLLHQQFANIPVDPALGERKYQRGPWAPISKLAYTVNTVPNQQGNLLGLTLTLPRFDFSTDEGMILSYQYAFLVDTLRKRLRYRGGELVNASLDYRADGLPGLSLVFRVGNDPGFYPDKRPMNMVLLENIENGLASFAATPLDQKTMSQLKAEMLGEMQQWYATARNRAGTEANLLQQAALGRYWPVDPTKQLQLVKSAQNTLSGEQLSKMLAEALKGPRYLHLVQEWEWIKFIPDQATLELWYHYYKPELQTAQLPDNQILTLPAPKYEAGKVIDSGTVGEFQQFKLSNGMNVLLHTMPQANDLIAFRMDASGGKFQFDQEKYATALTMGSALAGASVTQIPAYELNRTRQSVGLTFTTYVEDDYQGFKGISPLGGLETAFAEIHHRMTRDEKIERFGDHQLPKEEDRFEDYNGLVNRELRPAAFGGDYRLKTLDPELRKNLLRYDHNLAYRQLFGDPSQFTLMIAGPVTEKDIKPLLEKWLANIPKLADASVPKVEPLKPVSGGEVQITDPKLKTAQVRIEFNSVQAPYTVKLGATMRVLDAIISERLRKRLRDIDGDTYSPWTSFNVNQGPSHWANLTLGFDVAPKQEEAAIALTQDILSQLREQGVSAEELSAAQQIWQRELTTELSEPDTLLERAFVMNQAGLSLNDISALRKAVQSLTIADIQQGAQQLLATKWMTVGRLTPNPRM